MRHFNHFGSFFSLIFLLIEYLSTVTFLLSQFWPHNSKSMLVEFLVRCLVFYLVSFFWRVLVVAAATAVAPHTFTSLWRVIAIKKTILLNQISRLSISRQLFIVVWKRTNGLPMNPAARNNQKMFHLFFQLLDYEHPDFLMKYCLLI